MPITIRRRSGPAARRSGTGPHTAARERGQSLVEFALMFPLFMLLLFGIIEFMFIFNAQLSLNYATRDAALIAAEAGNLATADCLILQAVDNDLTPPTAVERVQTVHIFSATEAGRPLAAPKEQAYTRGGTTSCGSISVPYTLVTNDYPFNVRCSDFDRTGCSPTYTGPSNTGVDIIGVRIDYDYGMVTPILGGGTISMSTANAMRMEPIL